MAKRADATDRTRRGIEAALIRLLAARPYHGITMVDIAAEADVAVRTVQRHYRAKDDLLLRACLIEPADALVEFLNRPSARFPEQALAKVVESQFEFYDVHSGECRAVYARAGDAPDVQQALREALDTRLSRIRDFVACWPEVWAVDTDLATRTLAALTSFPAWRGFTESGRFSPAEAASEVTVILCQRLLRPSRP